MEFDDVKDDVNVVKIEVAKDVVHIVKGLWRSCQFQSREKLLFRIIEFVSSE